MPEEIKARDFTILLEPKAVTKIESLLRIAENNEWMALLLQDKNKTDAIHIKDIFLPFQSVSGASCTLDTEKFGDEMETLVRKEPEVIEDFCGFIHSHGGYGKANFSPGDESNLHDKLLNYISGEYFISVLVNRDFSMKGNVFIRIKFGNFQVEDVPIKIDLFDENIHKKIEKDWKLKITTKTEIHKHGRYYGGLNDRKWFDDYGGRDYREIYTKDNIDLIEERTKNINLKKWGFPSKAKYKKWRREMQNFGMEEDEINSRFEMIVIIANDLVDYGTVSDIEYDLWRRLIDGENVTYEEIESVDEQRAFSDVVGKSYVYQGD